MTTEIGLAGSLALLTIACAIAAALLVSHDRSHRARRAASRGLAFCAGAALWAASFPAFATGALPAPGEYVVDAGGSSVGFSITEMLVNTVNGKFTSFSGRVTVGDSFATTKIQATASVASIDTGNQTRNEHLLAPDYFDAQRFPAMQFTSTQIYGTPDNFGIKGSLTIKGVTREVIFSARILDGGVVVAETKIDRTDFGVSAGGVVKNEVRLRLQIRLARPAPGP